MTVTMLKGSKHETEVVQISRDEYEAILRTLDALSDPAFVRQIVKSEDIIKKGKVTPLDQWAKDEGII